MTEILVIYVVLSNISIFTCVCVFTIMTHGLLVYVCVCERARVCMFFFFSQGVSFSPWPDGALTTGQMVNTLLLSFFKPSSILLSPSISPLHHHHSPQPLIPYLPESLPPNVLLLTNQTETKFHFVLSHIHFLKLENWKYLWTVMGLVWFLIFGENLEVFARDAPTQPVSLWHCLPLLILVLHFKSPRQGTHSTGYWVKFPTSNDTPEVNLQRYNTVGVMFSQLSSPK